MPGFITHYICAQAVLKAVSPSVLRVISPHAALYNLGAQGPDIFFYYLPGLVKKRTRGVGALMHQENPGLFLLNMARCLRQAPQDEADLLFAYTAGFLTHYALDASAHPYVYARSASADRTSRIRDSVAHRKLETAIDVCMLRLTSSEKPTDYKLWQLIHAEAAPTRAAAAAVSEALRRTYQRDVPPRDVYKAMRYMVQLTRLLQSHKGRRKRGLALIEDLTLGARVVSCMIHDQTADDDADYLNMQNKPWRAPWDNSDQKNAGSFVDLYRAAVADAADMTESLYAFTQGSLTRAQLLRRLGNRSLKTGETAWEV